MALFRVCRGSRTSWPLQGVLLPMLLYLVGSKRGYGVWPQFAAYLVSEWFENFKALGR